MISNIRLSGKTYAFKDLNEVMAKASEEKAGDTIMGIGAHSASERTAARLVLAEVELGEIRNNPAVPYEEDEVTRLTQALVNEDAHARIKSWTVGELRDWILDHATTPEDLAGIRNGFALSVTGAIVGEMVMGGAGLGQVLTQQRHNLDTAGMFVTVFVLATMAMVLYGLIYSAERRARRDIKPSRYDRPRPESRTSR